MSRGGNAYFTSLTASFPGFTATALLSFLMVITYHILRSYSPEWAFIPALAIGYWVFRSRIKSLVNFMKMLYSGQERESAHMVHSREDGDFLRRNTR